MTMSGWMRLVLSSLSDSKQYITPGNKLVKRLGTSKNPHLPTDTAPSNATITR